MKILNEYCAVRIYDIRYVDMGRTIVAKVGDKG